MRFVRRAGLFTAAIAAISLTADAGCAHSQSFVLSGDVRCVVVRSAGGDVKIATVEDGHLHVTADRRGGGGATPEVSVDIRSGVLLVENYCEKPGKPGCDVDFNITLPPGVAKIEVSVEEGDIDLEAVEGQLAVNVQSGRIDGRRLQAAVANVATQSGDIELELVRDAILVRADTVEGDIDLVVPSEDYKVDAIADAGEIDLSRIQHAPHARRRIIARTDDGNVGVRGQVSGTIRTRK